MALSMTGFGRGSFAENGRMSNVEIKSVNNRYCDLQVRMPRYLSALEMDVRNRCKSVISRGKLDIFISYSDTTSSARQVRANQPLATSYLNAVRGLGEALDIPHSIDARALSTFPDVLIVEDKDEEVDKIANLIFAALDEALTQLVDRKTEEGERLTLDILAGCANLEELLCQVRERAKQVPIDYKERLTKRIDELLAPEQRAFFDEQRMAAEVLLFVDKADIHEEMIRLESHLASMREVVRQDLPVGKQLDFFCQEVNREVNTIGSKANDLELTNLAIAMKSGLEKIREQVQNLE